MFLCSLERLCCDGVALLNMLVQSRYLRAVVHVLQVVLPLVYPCQYYLLKNEQLRDTSPYLWFTFWTVLEKNAQTLIGFESHTIVGCFRTNLH